MARAIDPKRTRKALRLVRRLAAKALTPAETFDPETGEIRNDGVDYSTWEKEFLGEVDKRLEKYGSAFANLSKGRAEDALSVLQGAKLKEIAAKARGKPRKGLATRAPLRQKRKRPPQGSS